MIKEDQKEKDTPVKLKLQKSPEPITSKQILSPQSLDIFKLTDYSSVKRNLFGTIND